MRPDERAASANADESPTTVPSTDASAIARYVMIGGFLGAGKTTAIAKLARRIADRGERVGLICNDQSDGLVDTALLRTTGLPVEEITGGCFCCRFASLLDAADTLSRDAAPDVFLAEPVGSCTDLVATVSYPLRRIYGDRFAVAPLSVLVDPRRAARILGIATGKSFSSKVAYVYEKQLEEADILVVNKCDTLDDDARTALVAALAKANPRAEIFCVSAKTGEGLDAWFDRITDTNALLDPTGRAMDIDYDTYAEGEALLGWLNATIAVTSDAPFDANRTLLDLTSTIRERLAADGSCVAHLKMTLDPQDGTGTLSVVSLVDDLDEPDLRESLLDRVDGGELVVNLRAEGDPEVFRDTLRDALTTVATRSTDGLRFSIEHLEQLRPGRPVPTHRLATAVAADVPDDATAGGPA